MKPKRLLFYNKFNKTIHHIVNCYSNMIAFKILKFKFLWICQNLIRNKLSFFYVVKHANIAFRN